MRVISRLFERFSLAAILMLPGCAGPTLAPDVAPEFLVVRAGAPFYRLGPQQAAPPDARLAVDDHVRLLRREFGYSVALLSTGETGYVANEDLKPAPPLPASPGVSGVGSSHEPAPDFSPIEAPLPKPDLNASPEDAPAN